MDFKRIMIAIDGSLISFQGVKVTFLDLLANTADRQSKFKSA